MKILIATDAYYPNVSGISYFTQRLAVMLVERGHQVFVFAPGKRLKDTISIHDGATVYGMRSINILLYPNFRVSQLFLSGEIIKKYVQKVSPDVIHIQSHFIIGKRVALAAKELGIPIIGTNHFMPENLIHYLHLPKLAENNLKKFGWNQFSKVYGQFDVITTPTKTAARLIEDMGLGKEIVPVSCGIDLKRFAPGNDGTYLKEKYAIPKGRLIILYVGRLDKEKMIPVILNALPLIIKSVNAHLVLAGVGRLRVQLESLVKKLGIQDRVTFAGFVPDNDLPNLYRMADLFAMASIAELQSIATMEAMASGLAVIAADAMALPELVHDQENGYLFPAGDSQAFERLAIKILSNDKLRGQMAQKSLQIIQAHDINKTLDAYELLYQKAIDQHSYVLR
ncbi:MAG: glycosyltransferase [bacterium]|nr:glycosyltransferase [bacterium]